ncbi:MAG: radical SAM protein [Candidatus Woesearchaeota archaeon]
MSKYKILVELTNKCNLSCPYCYYQIDKPKHKEIDYCSFLKFLQNNKKYLDRVTLTGGEPLLYTKFKNIINQLNEEEVPYNVNTNGTLLTDDIVDIMSNGALTSISISLDSALFTDTNNVRNFHKRAVDGLKTISKGKNRKFTIRVVCVLTKKNFKQADKIYRSIAKIDIDDFCFQPVYIPKAEKGLYDQLSLYNLDRNDKITLFDKLSHWSNEQGYGLYLDFLKKYMESGSFCSYCKNITSFWCDVTGNIYPCFIKLNEKIGDLDSDINKLYLSNNYQNHIKQASAMSCFSEKCFCAFLAGLKKK